VNTKRAKPPKVLFLCSHNSARSQMAEGLLRFYGRGKVQVHSAGTVATSVKPEATRAMAELGIDISDQRSKTLEPFIEEHFDYVITVCDQANESCPIFPNAQHRWHWSIDDPSAVEGAEADRLAAFRIARGELDTRIRAELLPALGLKSDER
jgi:arsenate reductase